MNTFAMCVCGVRDEIGLRVLGRLTSVYAISAGIMLAYNRGVTPAGWLGGRRLML